jgi:hypothetical protein
MLEYKYVLIYSCCYNKISQTGWLINNKYLFLPVLEAEKLKNKVLADSMSSEGLVLIHGGFLLPHMIEGVRGLCGASVIKVPPQRLGVATYDFRRTQTFRS